MPPRNPFFIGKNQVTFQDTIFLLLHALCIFLGASLLFLLVFFCFVCCNKWLDPNKFFLEKIYFAFHCQDHSSFHSYRSTSVLFFCYCIWLSFFTLIFVQILFYLCIKVYFDLWSMLVFIKRVKLKRFEWCWKREKVLWKKVVQKRELV
jgi:hypothetical protein